MIRRLPHLFGFALVCALAVGRAQSAAPAPADLGATTTDGPEVARFQKIEDNWSDAVNRRDQYALELVLSPLFVDVAASGDVTSRNQQVALLLDSNNKDLKLEQKVVTMRMLGDIAVANGTYTLHHKINGSSTDEKGVFTQVFERVRSGWLCINSQRTLVSTGASKKKGPPTAEVPFHIPLFSKDKGPH